MNSIAETFGSQRRLRDRPWYKVYVLCCLVLVGICSWTDRQLLSILLQPIKHEFNVSDTLMGLLGGTAFGLFYVGVALPIAWVADRTNRRNIIAAATGLWSLMTVLSGRAPDYISLFLCRMGVGIGEAGGSAPSQSLVTAYFAPRHRALAMGILYSYLPIGYLLSYSLGGWLNDTQGWRKVFVIFGLPGLGLAILVRATIAEPSTGPSKPNRVRDPNLSFAAVIRYFLARPSLRHLPMAGAAHGVGMFAAAVWMPTFMIRTYHLSSSSVGMQLALVMGVCGLIGTLGGGHLVDWIVHRTGDVRWYSRSCGLFLTCSLPFTLGAFLSGNPTIAMALFAASMILNHTILGPVVATVQNLAGLTRRAMAAAFYLFLVNLIASGLGPLLTGRLSDVLSARYATNSLRYSLLILMPITCAWAATHFFYAARNLPADLQRAGFIQNQ